VRVTIRALVVFLGVGSAFIAGCGGKQVCECAVHVGGTTPATDGESRARGSAVERCLEAHGGGTINGCPMPPSAAPDPAPAPELVSIDAPDEPELEPVADGAEADRPSADPFDPIRALIRAIDDRDVDAIANTFHPVLRGEVREELSEEADQMVQVRSCLERTLQFHTATAVHELPPRLSALEGGGRRFLGLESGDGRQALVAYDEATYVLLDTGC
jgi:hypothetical protein